jgi:hypothetical protein
LDHRQRFSRGFAKQVATGGDPDSYRRTELFIVEHVPKIAYLVFAERDNSTILPYKADSLLHSIGEAF